MGIIGIVFLFTSRLFHIKRSLFCRATSFTLFSELLGVSDAMALRNSLSLVIAAALFLAVPVAKSQSFIGVNYGQVADNLPPPEETARLLKSTTISKVRLYGADPAILRALAGTSISVVIGAANGDIASLASDPSAATNWVSANVLPFVPATSISVVAVGNEALTSGDATLASQLLPAMQNMYSALSAAAPSAGIKVSTVHIMTILAQSDPPSSGAFHADLVPALKDVLAFLQKTGAPFMINPYPYFAYRSDPRPETLAFCLFQPNAGRHDAGSGVTYMNMFDAQLDAVGSAMAAAGFKGAEIVVAETGWPYRGDEGEVGATVENARAYNGGLVSHLRSLAGTPMAPGKSVDTYIFALYDEDLKSGPTSERSFGLFRPDLTPNYDVGLAGSSSSSTPAQVRKKTCSLTEYKLYSRVMLIVWWRWNAGEQHVSTEGGGCEGVVRAEGGSDGRGAAGELGLRVRATGRGLPSDPGGRGVLPPQHRAIACRIRHEPVLPGLRPRLLGLRLQRLRRPHHGQPQSVQIDGHDSYYTLTTHCLHIN
ncbi:glucan endo-1,3-beta-glucosidase [Musa troglodytarum]|uniref:glucan endo-1,3-beta-D-glucosidase n=1 Tax=Musa troglodytarum TaxID=320322 RepID=A0A9E7K934_9LILI|nr:glucan endo-1,3-beta-glucosidase [Musa troglodytarum]